jgi:hypothetical protein
VISQETIGVTPKIKKPKKNTEKAILQFLIFFLWGKVTIPPMRQITATIKEQAKALEMTMDILLLVCLDMSNLSRKVKKR